MADQLTPATFPQPAPLDHDARVQWLVDRAEIGDLVLAFARCLDERDWAGYAALYVPDGELHLSTFFVLEGRDAIRAGSGTALGGYRGTWHFFGNTGITVRGDEADVRLYMHGVHRIDDDPAVHGDGGGWYDCVLRRSDEGWRLVTVRLTVVWTGGRELEMSAG